MGWRFKFVILATLSASRLYSVMIGELTNVEQLVQLELLEETAVLGENPPLYHFVNHKSHMM
jgi:hypothetical protein